MVVKGDSFYSCLLSAFVHLICFLFLFSFIRTELTKNVVLPELVELARDESSSVRLAAFETLVNLLEMFDAGKIGTQFL